MRIDSSKKIRDVSGEHILIRVAEGQADMTEVVGLNESAMQLYRDLNIEIPYTGIILVGETLFPEVQLRTRREMSEYHRILELSFENGRITKAENVSDQYK